MAKHAQGAFSPHDAERVADREDHRFARDAGFYVGLAEGDATFVISAIVGLDESPPIVLTFC